MTFALIFIKRVCLPEFHLNQCYVNRNFHLWSNSSNRSKKSFNKMIKRMLVAEFFEHITFTILSRFSWSPARWRTTTMSKRDGRWLNLGRYSSSCASTNNRFYERANEWQREMEREGERERRRRREKERERPPTRRNLPFTCSSDCVFELDERKRCSSRDNGWQPLLPSFVTPD